MNSGDHKGSPLHILNHLDIELFELLILFGFGLFGGFLAGLLGIGGGPIYILIFSYFIPKLYGGDLGDSGQVQVLIASTIFARLFAAIAGNYKHYKLDNLYFNTALAIGLPAAVTSICLTLLLSNFEYNKTAFKVIFILVMLPMLYRMLTDNPDKKRFNQPSRIKRIILNCIGLVSGTVTALSGLGGGFVVVPLLNSLFNIKIRKVVSISLSVILIVAGSVTLFNIFYFDIGVSLPYMAGAISLPLTLPVIAGVMLAAPFGVTVSKKLTPYSLRLTFIVFCAIIILKTLIELLVEL